MQPFDLNLRITLINLIILGDVKEAEGNRDERSFSLRIDARL